MRKLISCIVMGTMLLLSPVVIPAKVTSLNSSTIMIDEQFGTTDFREFYVATLDESVRHYDIILHSPGGNAFSCIAIMNRMMEMQRDGITFTTKVYGMGMSAGTYIWMMGDERIMYEGSSLMFHSIEAQQDQWKRDQAAEHQAKAWNMMLRMDEYIRQILRDKGMSDSAVAHWMDSGKAQFMSAETAYNIGIATKYIPAN